ncbi:MAG: CBS domain-containing protein [archaeon]
MKISSIMQKDVTTIDKDETVHNAISKMSKASVSKLPVLNNGKLVGIVTYSDLLKVLGSSRQQAVPTHIHVSNAMQRDVKIASEDHELSHAASLMVTYGISSLPVMRGDSIVGIVTKTDLVGTFTDKAAKVKSLMIHPVTISPTDRIVHAREIMFKKGISMLPVVDDGEVLGTINEGHIAETLDVFRRKTEKHQAKRVAEILVEDIMSREIPSTTQDTSVVDAIKAMKQKGTTSLLVMDKGKVVGVFSKTDILPLLR